MTVYMACKLTSTKTKRNLFNVGISTLYKQGKLDQSGVIELLAPSTGKEGKIRRMPTS